MILKQEWKAYLKQFLGWTIGVAAIDFIILLMYPSLQDTMRQLTETYRSMGAFGQAFSMEQVNLGTCTGFYGMYIGTMMALGGAIFAAIIGTGILAKEEGGHTAEYLFTLPYSRVRIVCEKILSILLILFLFNVFNWLIGMGGIACIGEKIEFKKLLLFHVAQFCMHIEVAAICILISACTKKVNMGVGLAIALLFYFADMMLRVLDQLKFCKYITPFYYSNASEVFSNNKIDVGLLFLSLAITVICLISATVYYNTKDLSA